MAAPQGISIAPDDATLEENPTWTRLDSTYRVTAWSIDRGRSYELDQTGTGTATVELVDVNGDFDLTNPGAVFSGRLDPLAQAAIALQNPTDSSWSTLFRGFVSSVSYEPYVTETMANVKLELVDALAILSAAEMPADGSFGDTVTAGNIVLYADADLFAVQTRINNLLNQFGWASGLRSIFTGNISLQETVYAPRTPLLVPIQEAAEAEFPTVANVYVGGPRNPGKVVFHGRFARFDPTNADYEINTWQLGDFPAASASPSTVVPVSPPLTVYRDDQHLYTNAIALPENVVDSDRGVQYVEDATAKAKYGLRSWSAENLRLAGGSGTDGLEETLKFATYIIDNYAAPRTRVGTLTVRPQAPTGTFGATTWALMCGIDISDVVELTTTQTGGGGFSGDQFFTEGIHYQAAPMAATYPEVTLTLDVSPAGYYASNPF